MKSFQHTGALVGIAVSCLLLAVVWLLPEGKQGDQQLSRPTTTDTAARRSVAALLTQYQQSLQAGDAQVCSLITPASGQVLIERAQQLRVDARSCRAAVKKAGPSMGYASSKELAAADISISGDKASASWQTNSKVCKQHVLSFALGPDGWRVDLNADSSEQPC